MNISLLTKWLPILLLAVSPASFSAQRVFLHLFINDTPVTGGSAVSSAGREGHIECLSFSQETTAPRDLATGKLTGRRTHRPIVISKPIDRASPLLAQAVVTGSRVSGIFRFFGLGMSGTEVEYYRIAINDAYIDSIKSFVDDVPSANSTTRPAMEQLTFSYSDIEWTWLEGGITFRDADDRVATGSTSGQGQTITSQPAGQRLVPPTLKLLKPKAPQ